MWRITAAVAVALAIGAAALSSQTTSVFACSGPAIDRVAESDVIVEGWITSYATEVHPPELYEGKDGELVEYRLRRATEHMELDVQRVIKGAAPLGTVQLEYGVWAPGSQLGGECGAVARDKAEKYVILSLFPREGNGYSAGWMYWFYEGPGPTDVSYSEALDRMRRYPGAASLPALGTGPGPATSSNHLVAGAAALGALLLAASFAVRLTVGRKT